MEYSSIKFDKKCPNCGQDMAENNSYCCLRCYNEAVMKIELERDGGD